MCQQRFPLLLSIDEKDYGKRPYGNSGTIDGTVEDVCSDLIKATEALPSGTNCIDLESFTPAQDSGVRLFKDAGKPVEPFQCRNDQEWTCVTSTGNVWKCRWVGENKKRRCRLRGVDGRRAFQGCPRSCGNDAEWTAQVGEGLGCRWVAQRPDRRCRLRGVDGRRATAACAKACCEVAGHGLLEKGTDENTVLVNKAENVFGFEN